MSALRIIVQYFPSTASIISWLHSRTWSQCSRTCYLHIQKPFHCNTEHSWFRFPTSRVC